MGSACAGRFVLFFARNEGFLCARARGISFEVKVRG